MKHYFFIILLLFILDGTFAQDDRSIVYRKEILLLPHISTNGYGFSYVSAKKRALDTYFYWKLGISELRHRKEIKGINPRYPAQNEFIFGKVNHAYPLSGHIGIHKKTILKNNEKAIGIRYFYGAGVDIGILKPSFYKVELVYAQDSSRIFTDKFDPEYHNVNNIKERASWFKGLDETKLSPGVSAEFGCMVDFSRKPGTIQGVGVSAKLRMYVLPVEILAGEPNRKLFFGFNLYYIWGKTLNYKNPGELKQNHRGWNMLKNH